LNGFSVAVKIACNLVVNKLLAIYIGPSGYAVIGQFQNIIALLSNLGGGVLGVGISKLTSQYFDDVARQHVYWKTAVRIALISSLIADPTPPHRQNAYNFKIVYLLPIRWLMRN
jgi:PST family polysaccharide transporter